MFIHYFLYPITVSGRYSTTDVSVRPRERFGEHLNVIFTDELLLFIPAFILVSLLVWFFNDKIKAR